MYGRMTILPCKYLVSIWEDKTSAFMLFCDVGPLRVLRRRKLLHICRLVIASLGLLTRPVEWDVALEILTLYMMS